MVSIDLARFDFVINIGTDAMVALNKLDKACQVWV